MNIKLAILDFDGTLCDTRFTIIQTMQETMKLLNLRIIDENTCASTIGLPLRKEFEIFYSDLSAQTIDKCVETYRILFHKNKQALSPTLFPNVINTLRQLREQGITLTIASSRSSSSLDDFIKRMNLSETISYFIGVEDVTHAKPHPEAVLKTLDKMKIKASHTIVVGDMPVDILMGTHGGAHTCGVTYGNSSKEQLIEAGAEFIIDDFSELANIINDKN